MLHGAGIWIARIGLLVAVTLHVVGTIALTRQNRAARQPYECKATIQATKSSRLMIWSGLTILAFVIYHLLHFTVRIDAKLAETGKDDPYGMVVKGFESIPVSAFYILAITLLCSHLHHGVASIFQTLGLRTKKNDGAIRQFSSAFSLIIWLGFISIPISILLKFVKS
jgi:succinate dehydrogenase / fumarate reductase cytochrome b subunit